MKMKTFVTLVILLASIQSGAQTCERLQSSAPDQLVSYLNNVRPAQSEAACISFSINELGELRYKPAVGVLTKFLDYRRLPTAREEAGLYVHIESFYPAMTALTEIGESSAPALLETIKSGSTSDGGRENAVAVWMQLHKGAAFQGVAALKQEADRSKDAATRQRLNWAALKAHSWCSPAQRAQCKAAALAHYPL